MAKAFVTMKAFADDSSLFYYHRAHHRIGAYQPRPAPRKLKGVLHESRVDFVRHKGTKKGFFGAHPISHTFI
jgi:hypothetical protein